MVGYEINKLVYMGIGIIFFAALFPVAIGQMFAVNVSTWKKYDPATGTMVQDTLAITFWNLIPWMMLIFGGVLVWVGRK